MNDFEYEPSLDVMNHVYLTKAYVYAKQESKDPTTQNGALLVHPVHGPVIGAANDFPPNINVTEDRLERPKKYDYINCAERNVIYKAAARGVNVSNMHLYCPFISCPECAKAIVSSGITKVVGHLDLINLMPERWRERCSVGLSILYEAGVYVLLWEGKVFTEQDNFEINFDGKSFSP
jgi:dCMP deaminase